ncbi:MAG TPA: FAD-dependent oxidoreductase [Gaiellaceae bacterium]|nr:FAD-dependent oxidoreductase [Gaiellaceae bacterium]
MVGGGYTGLWTALALKEREPGLDVVVLEADECGRGPSGRNGGFLHGYWSHLPRLRERFGDAGAVDVARASEAIVPGVRAFCEREGADVWLREGGILRVSAAPAQDGAVDEEVAAARELGVPEEAVPLSAEELSARIRSPRFRKGVYLRDGATVQPSRLALSLRRAVAREARLHEHTRVTDVSDGVVTTARGRVRAKEIVVGVNAAAAGWKPLRRRLTVFGSYVVLTEPVPELLVQIGWTGGEAVIDGRMFLHYFRATNDGRVLMGSGSGPIGFGGKIDERFTQDEPTAARAEQGLRRLLPGLAGAKVTHAWGGPIDVSSDHLPFFGTVPGTRIHYGAGYSGHGAGPSWLGGRILARLALGVDDELTRLPLVTRRVPKLPPEPLRRLGGGLVRASIMACEQAEEEGRRGSLPARAGAALPRLLRMSVGTR